MKKTLFVIFAAVCGIVLVAESHAQTKFDIVTYIAPAGWVHEYQGGRTFYSTMGQPEDFLNADFLRLLDNAIFWTARREAESLKRN